MTNPFQSNSSSGDFHDPLGFIKKLWGDVQIPGMVTPTVSVEELDQKIKDLKAVEAWLTLNMNMLRGSIQALEVQRSTIVALQTMGKSFAQSVAMPVKEDATAKANFFTTPKPSTSESDDDASAANAASVSKQTTANTKDNKDTNQANTSSTWALPTEAHNWWNVVQDQFKQALNQVMVSEESAASKAEMKTKPAATVKAKVASSTPKAAVKKPTVRKSGATKNIAKAKPALKKTSMSKAVAKK